MRYLEVAWIACAVFVSAPRPGHAQRAAQSERVVRPSERARLSAEVGFAVFLPSDYQRSLRLFSYGQLAVAPALAGRLTLRAHGIIVYGARVGWLHTATTEATALGAIGYHLVDVSAVFGLGTRQQSSAQSLFGELVAEAGGLLGDASLGKVAQRVMSMRVGGSAMFGWFIEDPRIFIGIRTAASYIPWNGGGGSFWDPALANFTASLEFGGAL